MLRYISKALLNRYILITLAAIISIHVVAMFLLMDKYRDNRTNLHRNQVIQKIVNAIYLAEATPLANRKKAVGAMSDPDLKVTLSTKPQWPLQFTQLSYWKINHALRHHLNSFQISIQLDTQQWLNLEATIYSHYLTEQLILLAVEILIFGSLFLAIWSVYRFTEPLKNFTRAATQLGVNLHTKQLDIYGPKVVRDAALALNQMQLRIQELIRDRTQMLAAISHDLRTPITRLKLLAQFIPDQNSQNNILLNLDEMTKMINETLQFTREDAGREPITTFDLTSLLTTICDNSVDLGHRVTMTTGYNQLAFKGRKLSIKRAITNLIQNAVCYGNVAKVTLVQKSKNIIIHITDDGPGIAEADMERVFAPFYRIEESRSKDTGGSGLGLAITRDIIQSHGGHISLHNIKPHGLQIIVTLPSHT